MRYLVAFAVLAISAFILIRQHNQLLPAVFLAGGTSIGILWWRNHRQEKVRAEQERQRVETVWNDFLSLNAKIEMDEDLRPWAFLSEFDARQGCTDGRWLYKSGQFYFVINSQKPSEDSLKGTSNNAGFDA